MRLLPALLLAVTASWVVFGQTYTISTFAGGALPVNIPGTSASLGTPQYAAADQAGDVFFVYRNSVLRLDATTAIVTLVAGNGTTGFTGDNGPAASAQLYSPEGLAVDAAGDLYVADSGNQRVRKVSNGTMTTVAGNGAAGFSGDNGPATSAELYVPSAVAVDSAGNVYIADSNNNRVRKVSNGLITTVAGNGAFGFGGDNGPATSALLGGPTGVAVDAEGNLFISDEGTSHIRKVSNSIITTVAGTGTQGFNGDNGPAANAELSTPQGIAVDSAGNLYIADSNNNRIREVVNGVISTVAGTGTQGFSGDNGPAVGAQLIIPTGVTVDSAGDIYVADTENFRIRRVSGGVITTVAGNGAESYSGDSGSATSAELYASGVALGPTGTLYVVDPEDQRVRWVSSGIVTTVAGDAMKGFSGDNGPATSAELYFPFGAAADTAGDFYIADAAANRIRKVSSGVITTVAGNGSPGFSGDNGPATTAQLHGPTGVAVDSAGNLYIADANNNCIREVSDGVITTVAGNVTAGFSGDNGPATRAQLYFPEGVAVDTAGNLYIADTYNQRVRKVTGSTITTVAGSGTSGFSGDNGTAANSRLNFPIGIALDSSGNLYIADTSNYRVRKVSSGVITTVAGNGTLGFSGDNGPATSAEIGPEGVAVDSVGNVYVADGIRVRLLTPPSVPLTYSRGTVNAASSAAGSPVAPGSIATVYGNFLVTSLSTASIAPLPVSLGGLSLQFGSGLNAPLFAVSGGQINFQIPWELTGQLLASLSVTVNGQTSVTQAIALAPFAPGLFSMNGQGTGQGAILDTAYNLVDSLNPATAGSTILQIYCTGLGAVTNQPPSGSPPVGLSQTTTTPAVTIGGVQAQVLFSGLAPGSVGEYQVDALVPAGSVKGAAVAVVIAIGGVTSNTVTISVQ